jgi:hypothetical protein
MQPLRVVVIVIIVVVAGVPLARRFFTIDNTKFIGLKVDGIFLLAKKIKLTLVI